MLAILASFSENDEPKPTLVAERRYGMVHRHGIAIGAIHAAVRELADHRRVAHAFDACVRYPERSNRLIDDAFLERRDDQRIDSTSIRGIRSET